MRKDSPPPRAICNVRGARQIAVAHSVRDSEFPKQLTDDEFDARPLLPYVPHPHRRRWIYQQAL